MLLCVLLNYLWLRNFNRGKKMKLLLKAWMKIDTGLSHALFGVFWGQHIKHNYEPCRKMLTFSCITNNKLNFNKTLYLNETWEITKNNDFFLSFIPQFHDLGFLKNGKMAPKLIINVYIVNTKYGEHFTSLVKIACYND